MATSRVAWRSRVTLTVWNCWPRPPSWNHPVNKRHLSTGEGGEFEAKSVASNPNHDGCARTPRKTVSKRRKPTRKYLRNVGLLERQKRPAVNAIGAKTLEERTVAPRHGFEPRFTAPKAAVLPLDDRGVRAGSLNQCSNRRRWRARRDSNPRPTGSKPESDRFARVCLLEPHHTPIDFFCLGMNCLEVLFFAGVCRAVRFLMARDRQELDTTPSRAFAWAARASSRRPVYRSVCFNVLCPSNCCSARMFVFA